jgi:outer membrane protein TolC
MVMKILTILVFLLGLPASLLASESDGLLDLWRQLKVTNLTLQEMEKKVQEEEHQVGSSRGAIGPSLEAQTQIIRTSERGQDAAMDSRGVRSSLRFEQAILDPSVWVRLDQAQLSRELAELGLKKSEADEMLKMALAYLDFEESRILAGILDQAFEQTIDVLERQAYQVLEGGVRSPRDVSLFLLQISQLRLKRKQIEPQLKERRNTLSLIVGGTVGEIRSWLPLFEPVLETLPSGRMTPEEKIERLLVRSKELETGLLESRFWPRLSFYAEWNSYDAKREPQSLEFESQVRDSTSFGLSLFVPIWSNLSDVNARRASISRREQTSLQVQKSKMERETRLAQGQSLLNDSFARFQEAKRVWNLAQTLRIAANQRSEAGLASFDDRLGPEIQYLELTLTRIQAAFDFLRLEAQELHRRGALNEGQLEFWDKSYAAVARGKGS